MDPPPKRLLPSLLKTPITLTFRPPTLICLPSGLPPSNNLSAMVYPITARFLPLENSKLVRNRPWDNSKSRSSSNSSVHPQIFTWSIELFSYSTRLLEKAKNPMTWANCERSFSALYSCIFGTGLFKYCHHSKSSPSSGAHGHFST